MGNDDRPPGEGGAQPPATGPVKTVFGVASPYAKSQPPVRPSQPYIQQPPTRPTPLPHTLAPAHAPPRPFVTGTPAPNAQPVYQSRAPQPAVPLGTAAPYATGGAGAGDGANLAPGTIIGKYELIREIGQGGMGIVYSARDTELGRRVAIKFLLHATQAVADRFLVEARATAQCNHENIVIIYDYGRFAGMPYMVLEFLEGNELRTQLGTWNAGNRLPPSRVIELMLPVARALARAHGLGIVHRDLKPENVFVTSAGQVKVLDFGIAKAVGGGNDAPAPTGGKNTRAMAAQVAADSNLNLTGDGGLVGTLPYMSPEQLGIDTVDHRSDLWTFGIMLYEMLVGYHPIDPLTPAQLMLAGGDLDQLMPSPLASVPELDPALARVVELCLRKRKAERMPNAAELVKRLEELLPGRRGRQLGEGESPFPGLTAFQETDADRFFGRTRDVAKMVARVRELPLTGVVGPSGVGKSSFIRAGVGPALKASGENWEVVTIRPGRHPLAALSSIAARLSTRTSPRMTGATGSVGGDLGEHDEMMAKLRSEPGYLGTLLRARARATNGNILLFVDQFEELYTLVPEADERRAFTAAISGVADDNASPLRVVVSMRSDFLDRIAEDPRFMDDVSRGLVFLQPPDRNGLRDALVQPVEMIGFRYESPEIVEDMLNALGNTAGALPLLQFAAAKLWDARDRQAHVLTTASYRAIGGVSGALATHADEVVQNMQGPAQKLTQQIMRRLVTPERTRAIVEIADLKALTADPNETARIVDQLVAARLLVVQTRGDGGGSTVEIVHESLIDRWPTLRRWLDEDQEDAAYLAQLGAAAKQWEARGRAAGLLWRGEAMEEAQRWYKVRPRDGLAPRDRAFLEAVFALARRGKRLRRMALIVTLFVLGGGAVGASVMLVKVHIAEKDAVAQRVTAEEKEKVAADALAKMQAAETSRLAAEAAKAAAEGKNAAEVAKAKAAQAEAAQAQAKEQEAEQMNKDQLLAHAKELEAEAVKLKAATATAAAARDTAKSAEAKAEKANEQLKAQVAALQAKINGAGISTKLH